MKFNSNRKKFKNHINIIFIILLPLLLMSCNKIKEQYSSEFWYEKGYSLDNMGRYKEALIAYDKAIEIRSDYIYAWINKGVDLNKLGRNNEAIKTFNKAIEVNADYLDAWFNKV